jgi:hypothetical protein
MSVTPEYEQRPLGGTVEEGDILVWSSNALVKAGDDEAASALFLAMEGGESGDTVTVMRITRETIIEGTQLGTLGDIGDAMGLDLTSTDLTFDPSATPANEHFEVYRIVDESAKTIQCRFIA